MSGRSIKKQRRMQRKIFAEKSQMWFEMVESESFMHRYMIGLAILTREKVRPWLIMWASIIIPVGLLLASFLWGRVFS